MILPRSKPSLRSLLALLLTCILLAGLDLCVWLEGA